MVFQLIQQFAATQPKVFLALVIIASLLVLIKSADMLLFGITRWARKLGLSDYLIGLFVVALTASLPEFVSAMTGLALGDTGIIFGTILGSNIIGFTLVVGIMAIVGRKLNIRSKLFHKVEFLILILVALPLIFAFNGAISRIEGVILIAGYAAYAAFLWKKEGQLGKIKKSVRIKHLWRSGLIFLLAFVALVLSARWLIFGVIETARRFNISSFIIASVIIGLAAQVPDLITVIRSELHGHKDIGMGDILGSTMVQMLLFLGLIAIIQPITISFNVIRLAAIMLLIALTAVLLLMRRGFITWKEGIAFLLAYPIYLILEILIF